MPKINEEIHQEKLLTIRQMLVQCYTDKQIIEAMQIPRSTFYKYKTALTEEAVSSIKQLKLEEYASFLNELLERLKLVFHHVSLRISDSSRISNRDMSTLASISKDLAFEIMKLEDQRYRIVFPSKSKNELPGQPALTEGSDYSDQDDGMDYNSETGEMEHMRSTNSNPIV